MSTYKCQLCSFKLHYFDVDDDVDDDDDTNTNDDDTNDGDDYDVYERYGSGSINIDDNGDLCCTNPVCDTHYMSCPNCTKAPNKIIFCNYLGYSDDEIDVKNLQHVQTPLLKSVPDTRNNIYINTEQLQLSLNNESLLGQHNLYYMYWKCPHCQSDITTMDYA